MQGALVTPLETKPQLATNETIARPQKLLGIQALRGIAALAVLAYHTARHLSHATDIPIIRMLTQAGHAGVDLFFVLSGFIILFVHSGDVGRPQALGRYVWQRFVRLMPIYWIALGATIAMMAVRHADEITIAAVSASFALLPLPTDPILGVAWTLQHELIFYIFFAVLIFNRNAALTLFGLWVITAVANAAGWFPENVSYYLGRFTSLFNIQFLFGMVAAVAVKTGRISQPVWFVVLGSVLTIAIGILEALGQINGYGDSARFAYGIPCALLIAGLAAWDMQKRVRIPAPWVFLGEASYSLYLFHLMGIAIAWQVWLMSGVDTTRHAVLCFFYLLISATVFGLCAHHFIEAPLLRKLRQTYFVRK